MRLPRASSTATLAPLLLVLFATTSSAQYVGVSSTAHTGGEGIITFNRACHQAHAGSRMCTSVELMATVNPPIAGNPGEWAWVRPALSAIGYAYVVDSSGAVPSDPWDGNLACFGWTSDPTFGSSPGGLSVRLDSGAFSETACSTALKIACCIPVPEPSAALSIPSGAAMVLALAKVRAATLIR